ncbi:hypothetical protein HPB50_027069 [Hyalomma asiaticum]|uniref:Uncharacterized protein n=1 Tax=Hyalomma asiaticum TaxID=266040 RepID=A0ACB7RRB6_HYAAI|nr:hypothetical protein HPB50_027069 [Hyalomma asiaticum]
MIKAAPCVNYLFFFTRSPSLPVSSLASTERREHNHFQITVRCTEQTLRGSARTKQGNGEKTSREGGRSRSAHEFHALGVRAPGLQQQTSARLDRTRKTNRERRRCHVISVSRPSNRERQTADDAALLPQLSYPAAVRKVLRSAREPTWEGALAVASAWARGHFLASSL